jgi:hypothetical protein
MKDSESFVHLHNSISVTASVFSSIERYIIQIHKTFLSFMKMLFRVLSAGRIYSSFIMSSICEPAVHACIDRGLCIYQNLGKNVYTYMCVCVCAV